MSFTSKLNLDSRFFSAAERRKAFGEAAYSSAQNFRRDLQQKMIDSTPTGRIETIGRGTNFQARFQRSRRGQRPAVQTRFLLNSIIARRISETSAQVIVGADYGETLQKMDRQVMTEADIADANRVFVANTNQALLSLI